MCLSDTCTSIFDRCCIRTVANITFQTYITRRHIFSVAKINNEESGVSKKTYHLVM